MFGTRLPFFFLSKKWTNEAHIFWWFEFEEALFSFVLLLKSLFFFLYVFTSTFFSHSTLSCAQGKKKKEPKAIGKISSSSSSFAAAVHFLLFYFSGLYFCSASFFLFRSIPFGFRLPPFFSSGHSFVLQKIFFRVFWFQTLFFKASSSSSFFSSKMKKKRFE